MGHDASSTEASASTRSDRSCDSECASANAHDTELPVLPARVAGILSHGSWLLSRARQVGIFTKVEQALRGGEIRAGSLCSGGLDTFGMCVQSFLSAVREESPGVHPEICHEVVCEIDERKLQRLLQAFPAVRHAYSNVCDLGQGIAWDCVTQSNCDCSPNFVVVGFPCTDLSYLNKKKPRFKRCRSVQSGSAFFGAVDCIGRWRPDVVVLENLRSLLHFRPVDNARPIDTIDEVFRQRGYIGGHRLLNTYEFGLPQRRWRTWLIYFLAGRGDAEVAWKSVQLLRSSAIPLRECLVNAWSPQFDKPRKHRRDQRDGWKGKHAAFIQRHEQHGLTRDALAWVRGRLHEAPMFASLSAREQSLLTIQYAYMEQCQGMDLQAQMVIIQFDQELGRCPIAVGKVPCVCPRGSYWVTSGLLGAPRCLGATELAVMQGVGHEEANAFGLHDLPHNRLQDFVGNAFSGTVCMSVFVAALSAWRR